MPEEIIAGHMTHWRVLGQGARPVLALHCSLAHGGAWAGLAAALPQLSVTAPDLPGHGRTADPAQPEEGHDQALALAVALATRIGGGAPIDLFGHSYGGSVALRLALTRPDLVRSLTLAEPVVFAFARDWTGYDDFLASFAGIETLLARNPAAGAAAFHRIWGSGEAFADLPARQREYMTPRMVHVIGQNPVLIDDVAGLTRPGGVEALRMPVLLLRGADSPDVVSKIHAALLARLPHAQESVVPGAGHMVPISHARQIAPAVQAHLDAA